jgi:integrase
MSEVDKISIRCMNIEKRIKDIDNWKISVQDKKDIKNGWIRALRLGELTNKVVRDETLSSYLSDIKIALEHIKKPVAKLTEEDIRKFHEAMVADKITYSFKKREKNGKKVVETITAEKPYSKNKKISIRRTFVLYLKWKLDEKAYKFIKLLKINLGGKEKDIYAPTEPEVEKMYYGCRESFSRFFIAVLFDTGARAEEFHNIRMEDVIFPKAGESFIKIRFRPEFSKTKGRTISCYWKHSTKAITDYYNERLKAGTQPTEPIFEKTYQTMRKFLHRLSKKTLGKSLHYHALRHASASHYIYIIKNNHQFAYRYSWSFNSPMISRYSRRRDMSEEVDKEIEQTEINTLKHEIEKIKLNSDIKNKEFDKLKKDFVESLKKHADDMNQINAYLNILKVAKAESVSC